jgi:hypothetical protein
MAPEEILLHAPRSGRSVYQFTCPACLAPVEKPADAKVVALLVSAGVDLATREMLLGEAGEGLPPHELLDPMDTPPDGPAFMIDDVLDFHFLLQDDRWIEQFLEGQP